MRAVKESMFCVYNKDNVGESFVHLIHNNVRFMISWNSGSNPLHNTLCTMSSSAFLILMNNSEKFIIVVFIESPFIMTWKHFDITAESYHDSDFKMATRIQWNIHIYLMSRVSLVLLFNNSELNKTNYNMAYVK